MSNLLFVGKDLPDSLDFVQVLAQKGRSVFSSTKNTSDSISYDSENIFTSEWNRASAISAHSFLIKAETKFNLVDEVVFYFDTNYFSSKYEIDRIEDISQAVDSMINGFLFLATEILRRADQRKEKIRITFLLKEHPSKAEVITNGSKYPNVLPAPVIVSSAQAAFMEMAENFASFVSDRDYLSVLLAKCSYSNELYKNEKEIAAWVCESLDILASQKNKQSVKHAVNWNKVGTKIQTGFSLFK